jgi:hypothetical protein
MPRLALAASLVLVLAAASVAAAATPLTAAQYRAKANAICRLDAKRAQGAGHTGNLAEAIQAQLQIAQTSYAQLRKLVPPARLRSLNAQVLANIRAGIGIVQGLLQQAQAGTLTQAEFQSNPQLAQNASTEVALWKKLGASVCAQT